jgi:N-terminal domain of galactosyltransferase
MYKISICTACGNRLQHLRETLPANINANRQYPNVEFVVLDYNSRDGMEDWVRSSMSQYIESGVLKYYKTYEPDYFYLSHSKNMVLKLSSGDITCMVDADNYTGSDYVNWINAAFSDHGKNSIITTLRPDRIPLQDQGGKLGFHRDFLYAVNGFDESLVGYGIDDVDLVRRIERAGGERVFIDNKDYLKFISHSDEERVKNHHLINNLDDLYLEVSGSLNKKTRVLYFLRDNTFFDMDYEFDGSIRTNGVLSHAGWIITKSGCGNGAFERTTGGFALTSEGKPTVHYKEENKGIVRSTDEGEKTAWKRIPGQDKLHTRLVMAFGECINRMKYLENDEKEHDSVNPGGWGKGIVYRNFDKKNPIQVA